jgi:hypothetical protein
MIFSALCRRSLVIYRYAMTRRCVQVLRNSTEFSVVVGKICPVGGKKMPTFVSSFETPGASKWEVGETVSGL